MKVSLKSKSILLSILLVITCLSGKNQSIASIQESFNCPKRQAKALYVKLEQFIEGIQGEIEYCANAEETESVKQRKVSRIIDRYFESSESMVQLSSLSHEELYEYCILVYLRRLINLKKRYGYTKVKLLFKPDYLGIGKFYKISENEHELEVSMWQLFVGYFGEREAYRDLTKKKFRLSFYTHEERVDVKINEILVAETLPVREYQFEE